MSRPVAVLRPEPGNTATMARLAALGVPAVSIPLFEVRALAWEAPDAAAFDALLLTSANAVRHAGAGLARLKALPVFAVGVATARAARDTGLRVEMMGTGDLAALLAQARFARALHLAGRERTAVADDRIAQVIEVYASKPITPARSPQGKVALVHSVRAGQRLALLVTDRADTAVVAISAKVAAAVGTGWRTVRIARRPDDAAMVEAACGLAD